MTVIVTSNVLVPPLFATVTLYAAWAFILEGVPVMTPVVELSMSPLGRGGFVVYVVGSPK